MSCRKENEELLAKLTPGDIVKFKRSYLWSDFAIYVGNGKVVHLKGSTNSQQLEYPLNKFNFVPPFLSNLKIPNMMDRKRLLFFYEHPKPHFKLGDLLMMQEPRMSVGIEMEASFNPEDFDLQPPYKRGEPVTTMQGPNIPSELRPNSRN